MASKSLKVIALFLAVWVTLSLAQPSPMYPGVLAKHSDEQLTLIHEHYLYSNMFRQKLNNTRIPDLAGNVSTVWWSSLYYNLTNIVMSDYEIPKVKVSIEPYNNICLSISLPMVKFCGKHRLELDVGPIKEHDVSGNFSVKIIGAKLKMSREVVVSKENKETVKYISHNCTAFIKDAYFEFSDPLSEALGARSDYKDLKKLVGEYLCEWTKYLSELELCFSQDRTQDIYLDMTVLDQPAVRDSYVEYHLRGEMRLKKDKKPYKSWPGPIPPQHTEKMLVCAISNWTLNSWGRVIHENKMFNYMYTKDDLQNEAKHLLDTTCVDDCFGNLFPNVSKLYPDKKVEITVALLKEPLVEFVPGMIKFNLNFNIKASVRLSGYPSPLLFSVNLDICTNILPSLKGNIISFELEHPLNSTFTVLESRIGHLPEEHLCTVTALAFEKIVIPQTTWLKISGIKIKSSFDLNIVDHSWLLTKEADWLMLDLKM